MAHETASSTAVANGHRGATLRSPVAVAPAGTDGSGTDGRQARMAAAVFAVAVVASVPVILYLNRQQWFYLDEWDFLAGRDIRSIGDLLRPHNEHWTTIPIVLYRILFRIVGLHHYWPYQLLAVGSHLSAAVLLRVVMRRAEVNAWIATATATLFVYFGTGREDIIWAFQVTFNGSLAFGLAAIVLADHHERFGRRDLLAIACGLGALMCSGIGVSMVVALGVTVLITRGWRTAAGYVAPLAATYLVWFLTYGQQAVSKEHGTLHSATRLIWDVIERTFVGLGQVPGFGALLAVVLVAGVALGATRSSPTERRRRYGAPLGLLVGAGSFLVVTGYGRSVYSVAASRYQHLLAAMVLPAIAVAATAIAARWRLALPVLVALLLVGLPGNIARLELHGRDRFTAGNPIVMLNLADLAGASNLPRSFRPEPQKAKEVTLGWLRDQRALGRIPSPPATPLVRRQLRFLLSLEPLRRTPSGPCQEQPTSGAPVPLARGDAIVVSSIGPVTISRPAANGPPDALTFAPEHGRVVVRSVAENLTVTVEASAGAAVMSVCRAPR